MHLSSLLCFLRWMDVYLLGDNGGHGDLQELLLQGDKGQEASVEEPQQL